MTIIKMQIDIKCLSSKKAGSDDEKKPSSKKRTNRIHQSRNSKSNRHNAQTIR